jgi:hypothetical protein
MEIGPSETILASVLPHTQTDRLSVASLLRSPLFLALVVTLANAAKPVLVDDTAYLIFARHIAEHPLDPYGFEVFWYTFPDQAMTVLVPPVLPYWLACGIRLFGEHPAFLKLWLFPFVWAFAWSVNQLLRRFARGTESRILLLIVLSPAVLPAVNLMLDVPALGLGLAAVAVFIRAAERNSWWLAVVAGLLAAFAMQTKYTALLIPPAIGWYAITQRRIWLGGVAVCVALAAFAAWELCLIEKYGESHFVHHALEQKSDVQPGESAIGAWLREKSYLIQPLGGFLGCLGIGVGLVGAISLGVSRRSLAIASTVWVSGFALIVFLPGWWLDYLHIKPIQIAGVTVVKMFWSVFGYAILVVLAACGVMLRFRFRKGLGIRHNADTLFLTGWLLLELLGYFALTPFPAARRVIGVVVVGGLLAARALSRTERIHPERRPPSWLLGLGVAAGVAVAALDTLDARPEKVCAERAAAIAAVRPSGSTTWFAGHWGFQFYCTRAGMKQLVPGQSVLVPGDVLVLPLPPDEHRFYRPHIGSIPIRVPAWAVEPNPEDVLWDDVIAAQTIPNLYGGTDPVARRDHPRLRVRVYRIKEKWRGNDE